MKTASVSGVMKWWLLRKMLWIRLLTNLIVSLTKVRNPLGMLVAVPWFTC